MVAAGTYAYIGTAFRKAEKFGKMYIVATIIMCLFLASHYIVLGPSYGFQYIVFGLIPLIYYVSYTEQSGLNRSTAFALAAVAMFVIITIAGKQITYPMIEISDRIYRFISTINILVSFYLLIVSMRSFIDDTRKEKGALRSKNTDLEKSASIDLLTGLRNRRTIKKFMDEAFKGALGHGDEFSILMCDIDNFKSVNDTYGHDCGDQVLKNRIYIDIRITLSKIRRLL